ncbi:MAG: hypothetical protein II454_01150 [Bacteroidales bacterium]|nr:hypothetical protein [Bacteroidales bacterium]
MLLLLLPFAAAALASGPQQQPQEEDKVHLISAQSAQLIEQGGKSYRKVVGPAKFLHNDTYLLCDTALWNVSTNVIDAVGHVRIIQDRTQLSSETLQYVVDDNMAKFRGSLVQLEDKDKNVLRTRYLDYNTKDSVAIFQNGAAMRDKDGQIIESLYGTYDSKAHLFVFNDQVNMYMDTTFVKTSRLEYRSDLSTAYFGFGTDMWQKDQMLSANDGWYDRNRELFFFRRKVHLLTKDQEIWSDTLYYHRKVNDVEMLGNVEIMDTTRNVFGLAGRFEYTDSLSQIRMTREPAIISISEEKNRVDTLYVGADMLLSRAIRRCDVPEPWVKDAEKHIKDISGDPVMEYRKKAAEEAAKKAEEAAKNDPARLAEENARKMREKNNGSGPPAQLEKPREEEAPKPEEVPVEAVKAPVDTTPPPPDTSKVNFLWGSKRVRLFRRDMQMSGDSLIYTDLDSLVRLYQDPIFFNEGNRQYTSDSIYMVIRDRKMQRAHLLSNAFITIEEAPKAYDQIRGTEVVAYFDSTSALTRFDALGGAATLFYLEENDALATVNKVETKMIYATFKDSNIERIYYYDNPKNDGYPTVQMSEDDKTLKGFRWEPEKRPKSPEDITTLKPRSSERLSYLARPHAAFVQTEDYFPGYINKVYRDIAIRDSLEVVRQKQRKEQEALRKELALSEPPEAPAGQADTLLTSNEKLTKPETEVPPLPADTLKAPADTLLKAPVETLKAPEDTLKAPADTLLQALPDTLKHVPDSLQLAAKPIEPEVHEPTPEEIRAAEKAAAQAAKDAEKARLKAEKDRIKAEKAAEKAAKDAEKAAIQAAKDAERQARWEELNRIDAEKRAAKEQKRLEKERARKLKALQKLEKKAQKERERFEKYLQREQEKAAKKAQKAALKQAPKKQNTQD